MWEHLSPAGVRLSFLEGASPAQRGSIEYQQGPVLASVSHWVCGLGSPPIDNLLKYPRQEGETSLKLLGQTDLSLGPKDGERGFTELRFTAYMIWGEGWAAWASLRTSRDAWRSCQPWRTGEVFIMEIKPTA